jgi:hypothetical protein
LRVQFGHRFQNRGNSELPSCRKIRRITDRLKIGFVSTDQMPICGNRAVWFRGQSLSVDPIHRASERVRVFSTEEGLEEERPDCLTQTR